MRAEAVQGVLQAALEMIVERFFAAVFVVEGDRFIEDGKIPGFLEVRGYPQHQPERVVVEVAADFVVAALGKGLELVEGSAGFKLRRGQIQHPLAGARRDHLDEPEQILVGIAESQATADAGFI